MVLIAQKKVDEGMNKALRITGGMMWDIEKQQEQVEWNNQEENQICPRSAQNKLYRAWPSASTVQICYTSWKPDTVGTSGYKKSWFPDSLVNARVVSHSTRDLPEIWWQVPESTGHHEMDPKHL